MTSLARLGGACSAAAAVLLAGCAGPGWAGPKDEPVVARGPAPAYAEMAENYNQRVTDLRSLWARAVVRIWFPDREGEEKTEQVEGHLQYIRPDKVNLTLSKVGEPVAVLGSNSDKFWWIELGKGEARKAHIGTHANADPRRIAELGLPVHPVDLIGLMGITPFPEAGAGISGRPDVRWSADGRGLVVSLPLDSGFRRFLLNPDTYEPVRIEVADRAGAIVLSSDLAGYEPVTVRGGGPEAARPRVPGEILASVNLGKTRVRMRLYDPETGGTRPRPAAFDLDTLLASYGVENVVDLDRAPVASR